MRRWIVFGLLIATLVANTSAHSQDAAAEFDRVYIEIQQRDDAQPLPDFTDLLKINLALHGLDVIYVPADSYADYGSFWFGPSLVLTFEDYGEPLRVARPSTYNIAEYPPLPAASFGAGIGFSVHYDETPDILERELNATLNQVTGLALYAVRRCEDADRYLAQAEDEARVLEASELLLESIEFYRANCAAALGDLDRARATYERLIARATLSQAGNGGLLSAYGYLHFLYPAYVNLAWVYIQQGEDDAARDALAVIDALPYINDYQRAEALKFRSRVLLEMGLNDEALRDMDDALRLQPNDPYLLVERGRLYLALANADSAITDFDAAIGTDGNNADAYYHRALARLETGVDTPGYYDLRQYLELAPDGFYAAEARAALEAVQ